MSWRSSAHWVYSRAPRARTPSAWSRMPMSATRTSTALFWHSKKSLPGADARESPRSPEECSVQCDQPVDQVHDAVRVAPLVVVPGHYLEESVAVGPGGKRVEDRGMRVADDVGG